MSERTVYASAARTATPTAVDIRTGRYKGVQIVIDVTAVTSTPSTTPKIEGVDSLSGKAYTILTGAAIAATGTVVLRVYPGCIASANLVANDVLPEQIRITLTHGNANSMTYTVSAHLIP
jgi:hypothetical protein